MGITSILEGSLLPLVELLEKHGYKELADVQKLFFGVDLVDTDGVFQTNQLFNNVSRALVSEQVA